MSNEKTDPESLKTMSRQEQSRLAENLQKRILRSMNNSFVSPQTVAWLRNMNEDVSLTNSSGHSPDMVLNWIVIVDKLFDEFQRYAFQYNQNEPNNSFIVSVRRPAPGGTDQQKYEGFVFNSQSSMLVTAKPKSVKVGIVPPRYLYEQEEYRTDPVSFLTIRAENTDAEEVWNLDGTILQYGQLPKIAKKVFARLIRVTRGECSEGEPLKIEFSTKDKSSESQQSEHQPSRIDIITECILQILENLDAEIVDVEREGMAALKAKDLEKDKLLYNQSEALRSLRKKGAEFAQQWAGALMGDQE